VKACALSNTDVRVRRGEYRLITETPHVVGYEISGVIEEVGSLVEEMAVGDEVVALAPMDSHGGCAEFAVLNCFHVAAKPTPISHEDAAASLLAGLRAYTALHYQLKIIAGETMLILNGASESGHLAVQLASLLGVRVLTSASSLEEMTYLEDLNVKIARIIDLNTISLLDAVMEETGGLGVDAILDSSVVAQDPDVMVNCLAVHGRWTHANPSLQLDPPDSERMFFKNITMGFMFEQSWVLSSCQQGRFMHILADVMSKVRQDEIRPKVQRVMQLERIREAHRVLQTNRVGKIVIKL